MMSKLTNGEGENSGGIYELFPVRNGSYGDLNIQSPRKGFVFSFIYLFIYFTH